MLQEDLERISDPQHLNDIEQAIRRDLDRRQDEGFDEVHDVNELPQGEKLLHELKENYYEECEAFTNDMAFQVTQDTQ